MSRVQLLSSAKQYASRLLKILNKAPNARYDVDFQLTISSVRSLKTLAKAQVARKDIVWEAQCNPDAKVHAKKTCKRGARTWVCCCSETIQSP